MPPPTPSPRIVTFGGGSGAPVILRSLMLAGFDQLSAITVAADSGGKTGILRSDERDRIIAVSDLLRSLLAMIPPKDSQLPQVTAFTDLMSFTDGRSRNLGYTLYYALLEKYHSDFSKVQDHLERLLQIRFAGTAIPVSLEPTHIHFNTQSQTEFVGEHELDRQSMSKNMVTRFWIDPPVTATPAALSAIACATHIIYCPGSIYGSILANFLPHGITAALKASRAKKILITNLVSTRNQNHLFTPSDYLQIFRTYTQLTKPFDVIVSPDLSFAQFNSRYPQVAAAYEADHSYFLGWPPAQYSPLTRLGIDVIRTDLFSITPALNRIRHEPEKLAPLLRSLIV